LQQFIVLTFAYVHLRDNNVTNDRKCTGFDEPESPEKEAFERPELETLETKYLLRKL
jgi:hypothetical protein